MDAFNAEQATSLVNFGTAFSTTRREDANTMINAYNQQSGEMLLLLQQYKASQGLDTVGISGTSCGATFAFYAVMVPARMTHSNTTLHFVGTTSTEWFHHFLQRWPTSLQQTRKTAAMVMAIVNVGTDYVALSLY